MAIASTLLYQILKMFILMGIGIILYRKKIIDEYSTKGIATILLKLVTPVLIFNSFQVEKTDNLIKMILITLVLSIIVFSVGILSSFIIKKDHHIERFGVVFANVSFMGIPLVQTTIGNDYIIFLAIYVILFNIMIWTYGLYIMTNDISEIHFKKILTNPNVIALVIGLFFFLTDIDLPIMITEVTDSITMLNTPLAMIVLGSYIGKEKILDIFKAKKLYLVALVKLIIVPLISICILSFVDVDVKLKLVLFICSAAPTATTAAMFAQIYEQDYGYTARLISLSTILCLITIPVLSALALNIW